MVQLSGISEETRKRINILKAREGIKTINKTIIFMLDYFDRFLVTKQDIEDIVQEECACSDRTKKDIVERIMGLKI